MKIIIVFLIVILCFGGRLSAQERDTLVEKIIVPAKSAVLPDYPGMQMSQGSLPMPSLLQDSKSGFKFSGVVSPTIDYNLMTGWKTETVNSIGLISRFPFVNNPLGFYRQSVWDIYQGIYGVRTYAVNNKLFVGTAGYSEKSFNEYSQKSGLYPQTNYSSSLFFGYKFSEKFSISAGFTIQHNGDPLNRNPGMQNGGMFP
jgi:hypothetical protein